MICQKMQKTPICVEEDDIGRMIQFFFISYSIRQCYFSGKISAGIHLLVLTGTYWCVCAFVCALVLTHRGAITMGP